MNSPPLPLIMVAMAAKDTTTETRQAAPKRQSKAKSNTSRPATMAAAPEMSGSMCASRVSVEAAQPSTMRRSSPVACVSK